jgi:predicted dehydrogenase/aryl-alcohol dehydrogenase-like predicted oxidoreductase
MSDRLAWGILGTGAIARLFAGGVRESRTGELVAVGSRTREAAERFGDEWDIPRRHASYEALLADDRVEAVYVATPHPFHAEWAIKAAEAGKHILCEKPLGLNHAEAMAIVEAAREHGVFLMEGFMYRCHPQTARLVELLRERAIGDVRLVQATFAFDTPFKAERRVYSNALGGGGILDVGCYCVSLARLVAGVAAGQGSGEVAEPEQVTGAGKLNEQTGVDEYALATLKFPGGILAPLATGVRVRMENAVRIYGSEGEIVLPSPWLPGRDGELPRIVVRRHGEEPRELVVESAVGRHALYAMEADTVAAHLDARQAAFPAPTWEDTLGNMRALDAWREAIGLVYEAERPGARTLPVHGRPLARRTGPDAGAMRYGHITGLEKPVSRLVMGCDNQRTWPHAAVLWDDFFERGGTCYDTAYIYVRGISETLLGHWLRSRGVREEVVLLGKGAHTPFCTPEAVTEQLQVSLERLQTDYVDLYLLHRDNPRYPAGEFVEVLNEHQRAGRIRVFGASNWSLERIEEANAYAREHGLAGFGVVSNNFSLARMIEPPWAGCMAASDPTFRAWFERTQTPLFPWSSQARGFFTERSHPDDHSDPELVRSWYSEDNFARKERVVQLARERGVTPIAIALAYVLHQPFPTFALIGPRALSETRTSFEALGVELTPEEVRWLNLEA